VHADEQDLRRGGLVGVLLIYGINRLHGLRVSHIDLRQYLKDIDVCQYLCVQSIATIAASCPPLLQGQALDPDEAEGLASALKALADPARLRLLGLIQAQPGGEACVCHLTEPLGLSQPTVSHHLKVLREAGLVEREQRGSWAYFRVLPGPLEALAAVFG
jgi:ArsR family transcriptional regulator